MINACNNPIKQVIDVCNSLYPDKECQLFFAEGIQEKEGAWGVTNWPADGSKPEIWVDVSAQFSGCIEIIAHEFAHVVAGHDAGHGPSWEAVFEEINNAFNGGGA